MSEKNEKAGEMGAAPHDITCDVVIVGCGVAGLYCALNLPRQLSVVMLAKTTVDECDSMLAQGGICVQHDADDYVPFFEDTLRAGHFENRCESVDLMIRASRSVIDSLVGYGVQFERDEAGRLRYTREGAHSRARICFHDDTTGAEITAKLLAAVRKLGNVRILENTRMSDILTSENGTGNQRCSGIAAFDAAGRALRINAQATVWACGGIGGTYERSTNFPSLTGDALHIARAHGIALEHTDYVQIHPTSLYTTEPGECTMTFRGESGEEKTLLVQKVDGPAVWQGAHNKEKSIRSFARACFQYAIDTKQDLWFSTKDTIAKVYDGEFKKVFEEEFESYKAKFDELGITYFYTLIDDAVARVIRSQGGFIWACKNYDGDVMSDMVSTAFGSLAMMTSVLVSPDGTTEYEAAHGTVTKHYYKHLKGEQTSTNPMATIFAWSGALRKRGQLDGLTDLSAFADKLEAACFETLGDGIMTKDLVGLVDEGTPVTAVNSSEFIGAIHDRLAAKL